ncbi:MAG: hypothetical protein R3F46_12120 [bacterium]
MRPFIAAACLLACLLLGEAFSQEAPAETDWADCLSCHAEIASGLPALAPLRPRPNELSPSASCESCHERGIPAFFAGDWSHPVRSVGEHIGCGSCHPAVPHDAQHPPPVPEGDYRVEGCSTNATRRWRSMRACSAGTWGGADTLHRLPSAACPACAPCCRIRC